MAVTEGWPAKDIATGTAHILSHKHKEERVSWTWWRHLSQSLTPVMNFLHLGLTSSSPDNITNWGPSVPMPKIMGDISY